MASRGEISGSVPLLPGPEFAGVGVAIEEAPPAAMEAPEFDPEATGPRPEVEAAPATVTELDPEAAVAESVALLLELESLLAGNGSGYNSGRYLQL